MSDVTNRARLQRRLVFGALAVLAVAAFWFWGLHPARGLEQGSVAQSYMASNRIYQSLWETGYHPEDCVKMGNAEPAYTCELTGAALEQVRTAVAQPSRSYYLVGRGTEPVPDPVHVVSFKMADGSTYLLAVRSLAEDDRGVFFGFRGTGASTSSADIRWFRYTNPELGQVLRKMRRPGGS